MSEIPSLGDRLRGIVGVPRVAPDALDPPDVRRGTRAPAEPHIPRDRLLHAANALAGRIIERPEGALVVVDRFYAADRSHGRMPIGSLVDTLTEGAEALAVLARAWPGRRRTEGPHARSGDASAFATVAADKRVAPALLFLDIETTGLAGGAGTQAFLIGCAFVEDDGVRVRQFLLPGFEHERALLAEVATWACDHQALVTYNGRTFDVPLIETRYLFHRLEFPLADMPHVDMLHPSRRLWKARPSIAGPPLDDDSCTLAVLERHLAGVHRVGDVPGFEIPSRFFRFVRDGDAHPLEAVLEHNRIDLLSLALVTARAIVLIEQGPAATTHPRECLGLGRLFDRAGAAEDAESCFAHAAIHAARIGREPDVRAEALRRLAICRRRAGRMAEAAQAWAELVTVPGCPSILRREAREALAIHHEHRSRQLETARSLVLDALAEPLAQPRLGQSLHHRLQRLERKIDARGPVFDFRLFELE